MGGVPSTDGPVRAWESLALNKVSVTGGVVGFQDLCFRFFIIRAITSGSWMNGVAAKARASCGERVSSGCPFAAFAIAAGCVGYLKGRRMLDLHSWISGS